MEDGSDDAVLPTFGRMEWLHDLYGRQAEHNLYYEFVTRAGDLISESEDSCSRARSTPIS